MSSFNDSVPWRVIFHVFDSLNVPLMHHSRLFGVPVKLVTVEISPQLELRVCLVPRSNGVAGIFLYRLELDTIFTIPWMMIRMAIELEDAAIARLESEVVRTLKRTECRFECCDPIP